MSKFEETMNELEYTFTEQDGKKLTYRKRARLSDLVLVIDLELKTIRLVSIPTSMLICREEFIDLFKEFELMRSDAIKIVERSGGKLRILE